MWQDQVLAVVQWIFAVALLPTILHKEHKPTLTTCALNAVLMVVVIYTYYTLKLTNSVLAGSVLGAAWGILAFQRHRINRHSNR